MVDFKIKDPQLTSQGDLLVEWAAKHMPVLTSIEKQFKKEKPLLNVTIGACLHVTKETAVLVNALLAGGAKVALCGSNPLSTQDAVAATLAEKNVNIYAWRGETTEEYYWCVKKVIEHAPQITLDDGADLVSSLHRQGGTLLTNVQGGTEETTTGVVRLRAMEEAGVLKYPIIAVNDALTKHLFDNRYGTGQSTIDGIIRTTNLLLAGKKLVICGYGWCGRGVAFRGRGMGATVIVTEVDPLRALESLMDGFQVMPLQKASSDGDVFVTTTGDINVIRKDHMLKMKDGAILANSGHFNVEISMSDLDLISSSKRVIRPNLEEYHVQNGKKLYLIAEGRLVNLSAAEGHPSEVMDMSFANQALCVKYLAENDSLTPRVYNVPLEIDQRVATLKLDALGVDIDDLTEEQKKYLSTWKMGTI